MLALFPVAQVCRQLRNETRMMVISGNGFAFSGEGYDYVAAVELFVRSLTARERSAVRCIYWPLSHASDFHHANTKQLITPPRDPAACVNALRSLAGLRRVVLRYEATDVGGAKLSEEEKEEIWDFSGREGKWDYAAERKFRRELAVRGMRKVLANEAMEIVYEKTWRAGY